jgi:hypothetical protein
MCASKSPAGARPDSLIADDVIHTLSEDEHLEAGEILIHVEDGLVTLSGDVPTRGMKRLAEQAVAAIAGVKKVNNLLHVDDGSRSLGRPGEAIRGGDHQGGPGSTAERDLDEDG